MRRTWLGLTLLMIVCGGCETRYQGDIWDKLFLNPDKLKKASYTGLQKKQRVAILVDVDASTFARDPKLRSEISKNLHRILSTELKDSTFFDPSIMQAFQNKNLNWNKTTYASLAKMIKMDVTRIVIVTVSEFRMHEPGNRELWQGNAAANVDVIEIDAPDPDSAAAGYTITAKYPGKTRVGVIPKDKHSFRKKTLFKFTNKIAEKFYDRVVH
jgi:hypothetical protein